jgi:hypothetical protein
MKIFRAIFDDWLSRTAGIILALILILVLFNITSNLADSHPLFGVFLFSGVPILFIAGGIVFILAVLRYTRQSKHG